MLRNVVLLLPVFAVALAGGVNVEASDYILLITDVHSYYGTSCVFFIQPGNYEDLQMTTMMHTWSRELSRQRVISLTISFADVLLESPNFERHVVRPLYVVILSTTQSLHDFIEITKFLDISYPVWLVIFLPSTGNLHEDFCMRPLANVFNLDFKTEMLVLCYDFPILREWYAVRDNITRTFNLATWKHEKGLVLNTRKSLYARRSNMFGEIIRVATVKESPFIKVSNGALIGLFGGILMELSRVMNFRMHILEPVEAYGSWSETDQMWTGVIGQLISGAADFGAAEITVTTHRMEAVDFTLPLILSRNRLYIQQPKGSDIQWAGYFKAFHRDIWVAIIALIVTIPLLLTLIKTKGNFQTNLISENYLRVWGIYCQQGLSDFPTESSLRLAIISLFVSALIVSSAYSASLISYLTVTTASLPFSNVEGFAQDGSYRLIVFRNSADFDMFTNSKDRILSRVRKFMKNRQSLPITLMDGFQQVCSEKVAFYTTEAIKSTLNIFLPCKIVYIETGRVDNLAMGLRKGSPYTGLMNYHLQRFQDNGMLNRLKGKYRTISNSAISTYDAVGLWGIAPILAVVTGGMILAMIILIIERTYNRSRNKRNKSEPCAEKINDALGTRLQNVTTRYFKKKILQAEEAYKVEKGRQPTGYWP